MIDKNIRTSKENKKPIIDYLKLIFHTAWIFIASFGMFKLLEILFGTNVAFVGIVIWSCSVIPAYIVEQVTT